MKEEERNEVIAKAFKEGLKAGDAFWKNKVDLMINVTITPYFVKEEYQALDLPEIDELIAGVGFDRDEIEDMDKMRDKLSEITKLIRDNLTIFLFGVAMKQGE